jgi:NADH-quinone oxidoreductase subunit A
VEVPAVEWTHVAIYAAVVVALGGTILGGASLVGPKKIKAGKMDPYECGVPQVSETRERFSVKFYLVAIMFILFDIETVFMIPWAVLYKSLGVPGLAEVGVFFAVLTYGLVYLWKRGGLEWD